MLKGHLDTASAGRVLAELAESLATGCLHLEDPDCGPARVYLHGGAVYAVSVDGRDRQPAGELGETVTELVLWAQGGWRFRVNERTLPGADPPLDVEHLLAQTGRRRSEWQALAGIVSGPAAVVSLRPGAPSLPSNAGPLLSSVDGVRSVRALARLVPCTDFAAALSVRDLVDEGLVLVSNGAAVAPGGPTLRLRRSSGGQAVTGDAAPDRGPDDIDRAVDNVVGALSAVLAQPAPSEPAPSEPAPTEPAPTEPAPSEPAGAAGRGDTDLAALLRELTSLGDEDAEPAGSGPRTSSHPAPAGPLQRRKKGLFGR